MSLSKMAAALSLAGLGAGGGMAGGGKDLTCGVCREVYRSPRFLPCFHTFCQYCVEGLSRACHHRPFPCPTCRKPTALPPDGSLGLQVNQYITAEELQQARDSPGTTPCRRPGHDGQILLLYCERCEEALCMVCKMTEHENHPTSSLVEVAARCQRQLGEMHGPLEDTIRCLTERSALVNDSVQAARAEGERVMEQVHAQFDLFVAKARKWRDVVSAEVQQFNLKTKGELTADAARVQRELDVLVQLGQRVQRAMDNASSVAEIVEVEKEMRRGRGNTENLQGVKDALLHTTVRPSLNFDPAALADDVVRDLLGSPVEVSVPHAGCKDFLVPIYHCGQEGASRRVHYLRHRGGDSMYISYGGTLPGYDEKKGMRLSLDGHPQILTMPGAFVDKRRYYILGDKRRFYNQKTIASFATRRSIEGVVVKNDGWLRATCLNPNHVTTDKQTLVVVEEMTTTPMEAIKTERDVVLASPYSRLKMYRYKPPNTEFHPTDVCFWSEEGEVKLLVADAGNDSVHVVRLGRVALPTTQERTRPNSEFHDDVGFERYLAPGDAHLVHPTALSVDNEGRVWVGCDNGWILRCDNTRENAEPTAGGGQSLGVENGSRSSSSHPSGVDSASVAGVRVENDSQSGVDSASVADLRVETGSRSSSSHPSGFDSASVADLRVDNASRSNSHPSGVDSASVADLRVDNASRSNSHPSGFDSASVADLRVENGSRSCNSHPSGVDSASVADLRVENDSRSSSSHPSRVDSASVADLSVENGSRSSSSHPSGVDSASVADLRVENGSRSSSSHPSRVDSASVADLRVENGSRSSSSHPSGVDSASVADLRVENESNTGVGCAFVAALVLLRTAMTLVAAASSIAIGRAKRS